MPTACAGGGGCHSSAQVPLPSPRGSLCDLIQCDLIQVRVWGSMFSHGLDYLCAFGPGLVNATFNESSAYGEGDVSPGTFIDEAFDALHPGEIVCERSPPVAAALAAGDPWQPSFAGFAVSLDGNQHTHGHAEQAAFVYYDGVASSVYPTGGPVAGGTFMRVVGPGLGNGSDYRCRYDPWPSAATSANGTVVLLAENAAGAGATGEVRSCATEARLKKAFGRKKAFEQKEGAGGTRPTDRSPVATLVTPSSSVCLLPIAGALSPTGTPRGHSDRLAHLSQRAAVQPPSGVGSVQRGHH